MRAVVLALRQGGMSAMTKQPAAGVVAHRFGYRPDPQGCKRTVALHTETRCPISGEQP